MTNDYPWYDIVEGEHLLQGDFIDSCPVIMPSPDFPSMKTDLSGAAGTKASVDVLEYDVVIMSQSCDLEEKKLDLVLVCPHWSLDEVEKASGFFKSKTGKEAIRRGNVPGYHLLNKCDMDGLKRDYRVVDFRAVYSLPFRSVIDIANNRGRRLRLLPPYREHLSQAFARFFMRVGLPVDITPFK